MFNVEKSGDNIVIKVILSRLDINVSRKFEESIKKYMDTKNLFIDMSELVFIDSSCIGVLLSTFKAMKRSGGNFGLLNVNDKIKSILEITGLIKIFNIYDKIP